MNLIRFGTYFLALIYRLMHFIDVFVTISLTFLLTIDDLFATDILVTLHSHSIFVLLDVIIIYVYSALSIYIIAELSFRCINIS